IRQFTSGVDMETEGLKEGISSVADEWNEDWSVISEYFGKIGTALRVNFKEYGTAYLEAFTDEIFSLSVSTGLAR
mgnify:CR=1